MKNVLVKLGFCILLTFLSLSMLNAQAAEPFSGSWKLESVETQLLNEQGNVTSSSKLVVAEMSSYQQLEGVFTSIAVFDSDVVIGFSSVDKLMEKVEKGSFQAANGVVSIIVRSEQPMTKRFTYTKQENTLTLVNMDETNTTKRVYVYAKW